MTKRDSGPRFDGARRLGRSLGAKLIVLVLIFLAVPTIVYDQFKSADREKSQILLTLVQDQGRIVAEALRPRLETFDGRSSPAKLLQSFPAEELNTRVKVLFRPRNAEGSRSFYFMAALPGTPAEYLESERAELIASGVLDKLADSCQGNEPLAVRYTNPAQQNEILTSITPVNAKGGCWAVITSLSAEDVLGAAIAKPYGSRPEVQLAIVIYLAMAIVVLSVFATVWRGLLRFGRLARHIRGAERPAVSFTALNDVPELERVAREFDKLVETLHGSALAIRDAAEENAHAFKTPIGVVRQALEPLKRPGAIIDKRLQRSVELIERAIERLEALVFASRRIQETTAALIDPPKRRVPLSDLVRRTVEDYRDAAGARSVGLIAEIEPKLIVQGGEELVETVIENILDNAIGFSATGGQVMVRLRRAGRRADLEIADDGPGVEPAMIERIFDRYVSTRASDPRRAMADDEKPAGVNFGIGLWLVRRNVEAMGGAVSAENRPTRGLLMRVSLPLAA